MKVLIDTNIIVSAVLYPNGISDRAYIKAVSEPNIGLVCDYSLDEVRRVFNRKFPHKIDVLDAFIGRMLMAIAVVKMPAEAIETEDSIRDTKDRPILRAAIKAKADIILSGDKDFLESGIQSPIMMSPAAFLVYKT